MAGSTRSFADIAEQDQPSVLMRIATADLHEECRNVFIVYRTEIPLGGSETYFGCSGYLAYEPFVIGPNIYEYNARLREQASDVIAGNLAWWLKAGCRLFQ